MYLVRHKDQSKMLFLLSPVHKNYPNFKLCKKWVRKLSPCKSKNPAVTTVHATTVTSPKNQYGAQWNFQKSRKNFWETVHLSRFLGYLVSLSCLTLKKSFSCVKVSLSIDTLYTMCIQAKKWYTYRSILYTSICA